MNLVTLEQVSTKLASSCYGLASDLPPHAALTNLVQLAATLCDAPFAWLTLDRPDRRWWQISYGIDDRDFPPDSYLRQQCLEPDAVIVIPDTLAVPQLAVDPAVSGAPGVRFCVVVPLMTGMGQCIGSLSVADRVPRVLQSGQLEGLKLLGRQVILLRRVFCDNPDQSCLTCDRSDADTELQWQLRRSHLLAEVTLKIRQSLQITEILQTTVTEIRRILQSDRVVIFRLQPDGSGTVVQEAGVSGVPSLLGHTIVDPCFRERFLDQYRRGRMSVASDITQSGVASCYADFLQQFGVRANLVVPILLSQQQPYSDLLGNDHDAPSSHFPDDTRPEVPSLWGLLIAHQCTHPRDWTEFEVELLQQLADQVGIALAQSQLIEALRDSEQRFHAAFEHAAIGMTLSALDGRFLQVNPTFCDLVGYSSAELLEMKFQTLTHPEDLAMDLELVGQLLTGERRCFHLEKRYLHKSGAIAWVNLSVSLIREAEGQPLYYIAQMQDISERKRLEAEGKRTEAALREGEQRWQLALRGNNDGIWDWNVETNEVFFSARWKEMLGFQDHEIANHLDEWAKRVHPDDLELVTQLIRDHFDGKTPYYISEHRLQCKDGSYKWILDRGQALWDETGQVIRMAGSHTDITDRKQAEEKILEQAALLNITTDAIVVCDLQNQILFWNQGAERLYGWTAAAAIGQNASQLLDLTPPAQVEAMLQTILHQGQWQGELTKVTQDGKELLVESRCSLVREDTGNPKSILIVDTDITEKKQLERQFLRAQRLESIGTLASGIAHDLNNILTPILAASQLLLLKLPQLDDRSQQLLEILETNAKRGADLVKQVLSFARGVEGQHMTLQVRHLILELTKVVKETFPKSIEICLDIPQTLWTISGDSTHLHQVLMNLCVNARDAMPRGGTLSISATNLTIDEQAARMNLEARVGNYIAITVADTGMGIAPEVIDRVFEPFFTTKPTGKGTGLGLSTVMGIVRSHHGFISVSSQLGKGTQFRVFLPAVAEGKESATIAHANLPMGQGELLLLVDDEMSIRQVTKTTLETANYQVLTASDGFEAIALYAQHKKDIRLVLMDIMMPSMDGLIAIRTLRKITPQLKIVATSGLLSDQQLTETPDSHIQAFLPKPYSTDDLLQTLHHLLRRDG